VTAEPVRLGLRENAAQFSLLVLINAFVGLMVGLERAVLPLVGRESFHLAQAPRRSLSSSRSASPRRLRISALGRWRSASVADGC
jgi:hypothetical protein